MHEPSQLHDRRHSVDSLHYGFLVYTLASVHKPSQLHDRRHSVDSLCFPGWYFLQCIYLFLSLCNSTCALPDPISPSGLQVSLRVCHAAVMLLCVKKFPVKSNVPAFNFAFYYHSYIKGSVDELACANVLSRKRLRYTVNYLFVRV